MALTIAEKTALEELEEQRHKAWADDELLLNYYRGQQRIAHLGMAIPPELRQFVVVVNWPRTVVDTIVDRQQLKALFLPGEESADPTLRSIAEASNLESQLRMFNKDRCVFGRAFMSVGTHPDGGLPLIRTESPREMFATIDPLTERVSRAARFHGVDENGWGPTHATLYLPNVTKWVKRSSGDAAWTEVRKDEHKIGAVPVIVHLNRRLSTSWHGESQMSDIIPLTDAAVRALTNMQFTQEAHGAPRKYVTGATLQDFTDANGKPVPAWEAYLDAIHILSNEDAKIGQLSAADLSNFETALKIYGTQAATVTGFPARYFGIHSTQPPTEGSVRADEASLVRSVEAQNAEVGTSLGWVGALALRLHAHEWVEGNRIRAEFFDPATPTVAQRMDAVVKAKQSGILSREGAWDELGWSEARKDKERGYFTNEAADPELQAALALLGSQQG